MPVGAGERPLLPKNNFGLFVQEVNEPSQLSLRVMEVKGYGFSDFITSEGS